MALKRKRKKESRHLKSKKNCSTTCQISDKPEPGPLFSACASLLDQGRFGEANDQGLQLMRNGRLEEAAAVFKDINAVHPFGPVYYNLGLVYFQQGEFSEAHGAFIRSVELDPKNPEVLFKLGNTCFQLNRFQEAVSVYGKALSLSPDLKDVEHNLTITLSKINDQGLALMKEGALDEAEVIFKEVLAIREMAPVYYNLGTLCQKQNRLDEAEGHLRQAILLNPVRSEVHYNLGMTLYKQGRPEEAVSSFEEALKLNPHDPDHYGGMGLSRMGSGAVAEAVSWYRKGLEIDPDHADIHRNLAMAFLIQGNFEEGFKEYEWRWWTKELAPYRREGGPPLWDGRIIPGQHIYVWGEQGIGDEISFSSMIPDLMRTGSRITLESERRLVPLFERSFPGVSCVAREERVCMDADWQIPSGGLARFFRKKEADFPQNGTYLRADEAYARELRRRYGERGAYIVGISWKTRSSGRYRYEPLEKWGDILNFPGVCFVNLQYGACDEDICRLQSETGATLYHDAEIDPLKDMDGFASQVAAMDLVISIDNSTVVMASALGKPVWTLLPLYSSYFQWMERGEKSPWYPAMRLFRQTKTFGWNEICQSVRAALKEKVNHAS